MSSIAVIAISVGLALFGHESSSEAAAERQHRIQLVSAAVFVLSAAYEPTSANLLTRPQINARRNAEAYLSISGFSRQGLIDQLSSEFGSGYSVEDATAAVDSLNVDWNEQAVRSAKSYLDLTGFSCRRLVEQLSSSFGSKYTREQAEYGAMKAGAC